MQEETGEVQYTVTLYKSDMAEIIAGCTVAQHLISGTNALKLAIALDMLVNQVPRDSSGKLI